MTLSQLKLLKGHFTGYKGRLIISYQLSGNDAWNSGSLSLRRVALTPNGRVFQARAAMAGNARMPSVERPVRE